jgi:hypothetical protein
MLDRTLVAVVSAVLLVALTLGMVGMLVPFLRRAEFDLLCRGALFRMDALGGLPEAEKSDLVASLEAAGFGSVSVDATEGAPFGAPLILEVHATMPLRRFSGWDRNTEEVATLWFRKETVCRRISTYDGEVR